MSSLMLIIPLPFLSTILTKKLISSMVRIPITSDSMTWVLKSQVDNRCGAIAVKNSLYSLVFIGSRIRGWLWYYLEVNFVIGTQLAKFLLVRVTTFQRKKLHFNDLNVFIFLPLAFSWSRKVKSILFFTNSFALAAYSTMLIWPFRLTSSVFIKTSISFWEASPIFWFEKNAFK